MLKPKVGDLVRLKPLSVSTVNHSDSTIRVVKEGVMTTGEGLWVRMELIEDILPCPIQVGDRIRGPFGNEGKIVAVRTNLLGSDDIAWVRWDHGNDTLTILSNLRRIDDA